MKTLKSYKHTVAACNIGYVSMAAVACFLPLLFVKLNEEGIGLDMLSLLITLNFGTQILTDLVCAKFADKAGYRTLAVAAHIVIALGFLCLALLPSVMDLFSALAFSVVLMAVGGGIDETLISPIIEGCPFKRKAAMMSFLHSFFSWGSVLVIALSTLFLSIFGVENWRTLAALWAILPAINAAYFSFVPIAPPLAGQDGMGIKQLFGSRTFLAAFALMLLAGAAELSISEWASAFAESGLKVSKTVGDIAGPCLFAAMMGCSRMLFAALEKRIKAESYLTASAAALVGAYLLAALSKNAALSLAGCALCGFAVGPLWPGIFSQTIKRLPSGGTAMFALLAFGGDVGASLGPTAVGFIAGMGADSLRRGILFAVIFPSLMLIMLLLSGRKKKTV